MKKSGIIFAALIVAALLVLSACASIEERIVGEWSAQNTVLGVVTETTYSFSEDGTGKMPAILGIDIPMTYTIEDNKITMTVSAPDLAKDIAAELGIDASYSKEYTVDIKGDTLLLVNDKETLELTKKK